LDKVLVEVLEAILAEASIKERLEAVEDLTRIFNLQEPDHYSLAPEITSTMEVNLNIFSEFIQ
jgi:hypothetical protein